MGESHLEKVTRAELNEFAHRVGREMAELNQRIYSLAFSLDCLVTTLGKTDEVKAEIDKRMATQKAEREGQTVVASREAREAFVELHGDLRHRTEEKKTP